MTSESSPPPGFEPLFRTSPFLDLVGPFFHRRTADELVIGLRIAEKHANAKGTAHGGLLMTLCDIALGYTTALSETPPASAVTASITTDFVGAARIGDWVEAHAEVIKFGSRLGFSGLYLTVNGERIVRASGIFARIGDKR